MSLTVADSSGASGSFSSPLTVSVTAPAPPPPPPPAGAGSRDFPGTFRVGTDGTTVSATDYAGSPVASSADLSAVLSAVFAKSPRSVLVGPGKFTMSSPLAVPAWLNCSVAGVGQPSQGWDPEPTATTIFTGGKPIASAAATWSQGSSVLRLRDLALFATDGGGVRLPSTMLYLDRVTLGAVRAFPASSSVFSLGSGGPPGAVVRWNDVYFYDQRGGNSTNQYSFFLDVWYEGFSVAGGGVDVNIGDNIGWLNFFRVSGNTFASFRHLDLFTSATFWGSQNKWQTYIQAETDLYIDEVEFPDPSKVAKAHILDLAGGGRQNYTVMGARVQEVGPFIAPSVASAGAGTPVVALIGAGYR